MSKKYTILLKDVDKNESFPVTLEQSVSTKKIASENIKKLVIEVILNQEAG